MDDNMKDTKPALKPSTILLLIWTPKGQGDSSVTKVQGPKHNELVLDSQNQIRIISDIRDRKQGEVESAEAGSSLATQPHCKCNLQVR